MREKIKISIVVPVYNAKKVLQTCADSILRQDFPDWELLLVDDGSSDGSGEVCDRLAESERRIRVFHKPNGGVSSVRNLGIREAGGEYLLFVDSDDEISPGTLGTLYAAARKTEADLVVCGFTYVVEASGEVVDNFPEKYFCGGGRAYLRDRFLEDFRLELFNPPWNKLIRRKLLLQHSIFFGEAFAICEDMAFSMQVLEKCHRVCVIPKSLYRYHYKESDNLVNRFHANYYEALLYFKDCAEHCFDGLCEDTELYLEINDYFVGKSLMFLHKIYRESGYSAEKMRSELERIGNSECLQSALKKYKAAGKRKVLRLLLLHKRYRLLDGLYRWKGTWKNQKKKERKREEK